MTRKLPRLHAITNDEVLKLPDFQERAARITAVPGTAVHIRSGVLGGHRLTELVESTLRACVKGSVFVNGRVDVARIVGTVGVHLPSAGLPVASARSIVGSDCLIGRSAHSTDEVLRAADEGADYVFLGPIWHTASHPNTEPLGPGALATAVDVPVIAIGGITPEKVPECLASGAYGVAVISALWYAADVGSATESFTLSLSAMNERLTIITNGDERQVESGSSLLDLLVSLDLDPQNVVVELNRNIVRRPALAETPLNNGDEVELVHFVGGG